MINVATYKQDKEKGLITLSKIGDSFAFSKKQFNPETGEVLPSIVESIDKDLLITKRDELLSLSASIDLILSDL